MSKKNQVENLSLEVDQCKEKICQLTATNNMLNDQLQHALKSEDKHKESLEKVKNLSRRSVIGLESRLEKVTIQTQDTITNLQKKLTEENYQKGVLENQLRQSKDKEMSLLSKLAQSEKNFESWKQKIDEAETVIRHLNEQITLLECNVDKFGEYQEEIAKLQKMLDDNTRILKDVEKRNIMLQGELKVVEDYKSQIEELKNVVTKMQEDNKKVEELESQLQEERQNCSELKKQLQVGLLLVSYYKDFLQI